MVAKRYDLDEVIVTCGEKASQLIITDIGECMVEVNVSTFNSGPNAAMAADGFDDESGMMSDMMAGAARAKSMEVGRIAPHSVIAPYVTQVESVYDHVYHPETIVATTLMTAYTVGFNDFHNNISKESRQAIKDVVRDYVSCTIPGLWETQAFRMGDREWRTHVAWEKYCKNLRSSDKAMTYVHAAGCLFSLSLSLAPCLAH
jgi:hypothetical protein